MQTGSSYLQIIPLILNQFWPNLIHTYKIHFWISFVLCVVFKCQYFWIYSRKTHFWPFIYIFKRAVTHSKLFAWPDFFLRVQNTPIIFFSLRSIQMSICFSYSRKTHFRCSSQICEDIFIACPIFCTSRSKPSTWSFQTLVYYYSCDYLLTIFFVKKHE